MSAVARHFRHHLKYFPVAYFSTMIVRIYSKNVSWKVHEYDNRVDVLNVTVRVVIA